MHKLRIIINGIVLNTTSDELMCDELRDLYQYIINKKIVGITTTKAGQQIQMDII